MSSRAFRRLMAMSVAFLTACTPVPQSQIQPATRAMTMQPDLPPMRSFIGSRRPLP